jgi:dihydrofolate reductase
MTRLLVRSLGVSLDGFAAGPDQSLEHPLGVRGPELMDWFFPTRVWQQMHKHGRGQRRDRHRQRDRRTGLRRDGRLDPRAQHVRAGARSLARRELERLVGRRAPYHVPVFVLTHHARAPLLMQGGTTFHFVTGGIHEALKLAKAAAGARDVRVGGGVATVREYLKAGLIDELHLAVRPVLLGKGEALFAGLDLPALGYSCERQVAGERATHMFLRRNAP